MNDTSPAIEQKMRELIQQKTATERFKMGCSMHATSRYLITRAILEDDPDISKENLRKEIFLKFYGDDFDADQQKKIIKHLTRPRST